MKSLVLINSSGNFNSLELLLDDAMDMWKVEDFFNFFLCSQEEREQYVVTIKDPLKFQHFTNLLEMEEALLSGPLGLRNNGKELSRLDTLNLDQQTNVVELIELEKAYINPEKVNLASLNRKNYLAHKEYLDFILTDLYDFENYPINNLLSFDQLRQSFEHFSKHTKIRILYRFAGIVYQAPFENYSRLIENYSFFSPLQMWRNIHAGNGGLCAEKTAAFKFICDLLEIPSIAVFGSSLPIKVDIEQELVNYCSGVGLAPSFWLQHHILEINLDGCAILVDVSNGNLPLLFLSEADRDIRYEYGIRPRQVYHREKLYLYPCSELAGDLMLTLAEYHKQNIKFEYIFKQRLGLLICEEFYIGVFCNWGTVRSRVMQQYYASLAQRNKLPYPAFFHEHNLASLKTKELQSILYNCLDELRLQYPYSEYTGDFTFVFQALNPPLKDRKRVSSDLLKIVEPMCEPVI